MIQERWEWEIAGGNYNDVFDWLKRFAASLSSSSLVKDAYGLRSETGGEEFKRFYMVIVFESLADRDQAYAEGVAKEAYKFLDEAVEQGIVVGDRYPKSHFYYNVIK